jgi:carbon-monoxide dehydrogenase medium subunit
MYPDEFDYYRAETVDEALALLGEHGGSGTELLSGGHSLLPAMKTGLSSPDVLIDIGHIESLSGVSVDDGTLSIGANTTYADVVGDDRSHQHAPALADAVSQVGDRQVRNRGTIGGNLAHADPASDLPGAVLAVDASVVVRGPDGEREIPVDDFFWGMYATDVGEDELVTRVEVPSATDAVGVYAKKPSPSSGYAMIGVAAQLELDGSRVASAGVGANGAMDHGVRLDPVEDALEGAELTEDTIEEAAGRATEDLDEAMMMEDLQASAEFRAQLLGVYTERALEAVADRAATPAAAD